MSNRTLFLLVFAMMLMVTAMIFQLFLVFDPAFEHGPVNLWLVVAGPAFALLAGAFLTRASDDR